MQLRPPHSSLYEEYSDIVETFTDAEGLFDRKRIEKEEKLYQLTLLKFSQYQQRVDWEKVRVSVRKKTGFPEDVTMLGPPEPRRRGGKQVEAETGTQRHVTCDS